MKKSALFVWISVWLSASLCAQESPGSKLDTLSSATFAKRKDVVFMQQVPTSSLWKLPLTRFVERSSYTFRPPAFPAPRSSVAYERKLNRALSLNIGLGLSINSQIEYAGLNIEPRWYLGMRRQIARGERANNLSGNYLGLQLAVFQYRGVDNSITTNNSPIIFTFYENDPLPQSTGAAALLNFGIQRRILKRSYLNLRAGIGASYHQNTEIEFSRPSYPARVKLNEEWRPAFQVEFAFGMLLGQDKAKKQQHGLTTYGFREERRLFKVNLANLIRGGSQRFYSGNLTLAYEQKLGDSPISVQLDATGHYKGYYNQAYYFTDIFFELGFEPRYYYKLGKHTEQGMLLNNLSSSYITLRSSYRIDAEELDQAKAGTRQFVLLTPAWGFQRRIFERGYIGYQLGLSYGVDVDTDDMVSDNFIDLRSDFKFGLAF